MACVIVVCDSSRNIIDQQQPWIADEQRTSGFRSVRSLRAIGDVDRRPTHVCLRGAPSAACIAIGNWKAPPIQARAFADLKMWMGQTDDECTKKGEQQKGRSFSNFGLNSFLFG